MDSSLRELERAAASGGHEERAALLRQRLRAGVLDGPRIDLLAYCGDRAAQELLECRWCREHMHSPPQITPALRDCPLCGDTLPAQVLGDFVYGLLRWGHLTLIRGALVVAEVTLPSPRWYTRQPPGLRVTPLYSTYDGRRAGRVCLGLVEAYLENPCEVTRAACDVGPWEGGQLAYAPEPDFCRDLLREVVVGDGLPGAYVREVCHDACQWEDEHKLGEAVRQALRKWIDNGEWCK